MKKNIVIVDTIWLGHHPTYFKLFCSFVINSGHKVIALCPRKNELTEWILRNNYNEEQIEVLSYDPIIRPANFFFLGSLFATYSKWYHLAQELRAIQSKAGSTIDLVFFPWLDNYLYPFISPLLHKIIFPFSWSGIYFHPYYLRKKFSRISAFVHRSRLNIFKSKNLLSLAILDEGVKADIQVFLNKLQIEVLPDFADPSPPSRSSIFVKEIKKISEGKKVISLVGSIAKRKGVLTLINIAKKFPLKDCLFVFAGQIIESTFSEEEYRILINTRDNPPENCFFHLERISNESEFNAVIELSDIVYACYEDFPHSSNILAKAAIFRKPLIVNPQFCMAERVERYKIGEVVDEATEDNIAKCIVEFIEGKQEYHKMSYDKYLQEHSLPEFKNKFYKLIHI